MHRSHVNAFNLCVDLCLCPVPLLVCMHAPIGCRKLDRRHRFDELCSILSLGLVHRRPDADFSFPVAPVDRASVLTVSVVAAAESSALVSRVYI